MLVKSWTNWCHREHHFISFPLYYRFDSFWLATHSFFYFFYIIDIIQTIWLWFDSLDSTRMTFSYSIFHFSDSLEILFWRKELDSALWIHLITSSSFTVSITLSYFFFSPWPFFLLLLLLHLSSISFYSFPFSFYLLFFYRCNLFHHAVVRQLPNKQKISGRLVILSVIQEIFHANGDV